VKTHLLSAVLCLGFLCVVNHIRAQSVTYQDDFDLKGRKAGTALNLQKVGASQAAWEATPNVVFAEGTGLRVTDEAAFVGRVALPAGVKEVTVEAKINPVPSAKEGKENQNWMSVGIGNAAVENPNFGGLFFLVRPGGAFSLMFNPEADDPRSAHAVALKSGTIQTWNPDSINRVKLVYHRESGSVTAFANGDEEIVNAVSLKEKNYTLDTGYAGFSGFWQSPEARTVGGFSVTTSN
jgi:hypothetical protein